MNVPVPVRGLFQQRIAGDDALLRLAALRFAEAGMPAEVYANDPDELDRLLRYVPRHPVLPGAGPHAVRVSPKHGTPLIVALDDQGEATIADLPRDDYTVLVPASA